MTGNRMRAGRRVLAGLAVLVVLKVTVQIVLGYPSYFPPSFVSDFLRGRESYFFGVYQWAFYPHIAGGPIALLLGLLLLSERFRVRWPRGHRLLGKVHVANVLLVVAPSGLWMAGFTPLGRFAATGFALLSVLTFTCTALGWRAAVCKRFHTHRRWMWRSYLLLSSAVVLRLFGGFGASLGVMPAWYDPVTAWASWILPVAVFEWWTWRTACQAANQSEAVPRTSLESTGT